MSRPRSGLGIGLVLAATALFACGDNLLKLAGTVLPVLVLLWTRYAFQAGAMFLWLGRPGGGGFKTAHPRFQAARGALLLATSTMSFFGLQRMPAAEFTALGMLTPVVVTLLAATVLKERVSAWRWALVAGGFAGALVVIRPGSGVFGWTAAFPLAMALCYGAFQLLTSRMARLESPYLTHFYTGLTGAVLVTPFVAAQAPAAWPALRAAPPAILAVAVAVGALLTFGHLLLIFAFGHAPMATLTPFLYAQIGFAVLAGWALFRHVPDAWAWCGMAVIAVCGGLSAWLNARAVPAAPASVVAADTLYD